MLQDLALWLRSFFKLVRVLCSWYDWQGEYFDNSDNASAGDCEIVSERQGSLHSFDLTLRARPRTSDHTISGPLVEYATVMVWEVYLDDVSVVCDSNAGTDIKSSRQVLHPQ